MPRNLGSFLFLMHDLGNISLNPSDSCHILPRIMNKTRKYPEWVGIHCLSGVTGCWGVLMTSNLSTSVLYMCFRNFINMRHPEKVQEMLSRLGAFLSGRLPMVSWDSFGRFRASSNHTLTDCVLV